MSGNQFYFGKTAPLRLATKMVPAVTKVNVAVDVLNRMRELGGPSYVRSV
jgi:hypothetical protein